VIVVSSEMFTLLNLFAGDQLAVGKTPAWDAAGDLLAWQATDWLGHRGRYRAASKSPPIKHLAIFFLFPSMKFLPISFSKLGCWKLLPKNRRNKRQKQQDVSFF
jgi:hypothetical protein